jgi:Ricin-type beta-trefoil lectin domain-like
MIENTKAKAFVFVLMPFSDEFKDIYEVGIKPACKNAGANCERVDEQVFDETILNRIYKQISAADIIVAEMTGRNPTVFYEVGYAHALRKRVILLTQMAEDIPFDLKNYHHIVYGNRISVLKSNLETRIHWCIENPKEFNGSITHEIGFLIMNKKGGKSIDVPWERDLDVVHQWESHGYVNQQWFIRRNDDKTVAIISRYSGKCLGVADQSLEEAAFIKQQNYTASAHQHWIIEEQDDHSYRIRAKHSGQVLDVHWGSTDDGRVIIQWPWHGADNQRWWLKPALL